MVARSEKCVLTVGDGDLSFSLALSRAVASVKVIATTWLTQEELAGRYHSAEAVREELLRRGAVVLHRVDACNLSSSLPPTVGCPVAIIFNFPHLGGVADDGHEPASAHVRQHTALLAHFFHSAANMTQDCAALGIQGEVHVTLCGEQAGLWALQTVAAAAGMREQRRYAPAAGDDFAKGVFDGLCLQPPQPEWQCRRRWRNGSLGFVHWASRYGYEHRRHEGEQHMNINNCFTFVFVKTTEAAACSIPTSPTVCRVCLQDFENKESLEQHMRAPALPIGDASAHHCRVCGRAFGSSRALDQHMTACQKPAKPLKGSSGYSEVLREGFPGNVVRMEVPITSEAGLRLSHLARQSDKLRRLLPSKAAVKRAIARGELVLNGEHVEETRILKAGDLVTLCLDRVREALDATTARARNVKMVLPQESPAAPGDGWQVLRSLCPDGVVVVWKPAGMRSLGFHAGTLQTSLPLLPELAALGAGRFQPLSRLEIGCCGLSLVPVTDEVQQLLIGGLAAGRVVHTFRAMLHGSIGKPGTTLTLTGQESGGHEEASGSEEHDSVEQAPIAKADNIVVCHVVDVQHEETSIVDLRVVGAGRCCGALCHLMRRQGFPVVGDRLARRALSQRGSLQLHGKGKGLGDPGGAKTGKRKLQIECVGISASHEDGREFLDVRICRQGPASFKGDCSESDDAERPFARSSKHLFGCWYFFG
ncbi:HIPP41 [Symbiodinium sp. CCMP2456]|nr:HIPP41 [Symbiodinium sp. CCMP2456]